MIEDFTDSILASTQIQARNAYTKCCTTHCRLPLPEENAKRITDLDKRFTAIEETNQEKTDEIGQSKTNSNTETDNTTLWVLTLIQLHFTFLS